jgi:mannose-6-phosphate isomerase-like protein (cupin superfamily)
VRPDRDWLFTVQKGKGDVWIDGCKTSITADFRVLVAADAPHDARAWAKGRPGALMLDGGRRSA